MAMTWSRLLSNEKLRPEPAAQNDEKYLGDFPINPFELDYNRIVTSAAFRRLQDKTQVFPLAKSDFVRTRLTHSIEVSTVAYQMGQMLTDNIKTDRKNERIRAELRQYPDIPSVLRCAGLIHDLGNPPFGHFGEEAIGSWFRENLDNPRYAYKGKTLSSILEPRMARDLENFEGNAQALRLLCKANYAGDINVSLAVISSLVKYPTTSLDFDRKSPDIKLHKPGVYAAEDSVFRELSGKVGTLMDNGKVCRHPLTFLMEASDDIAYATSDLEDAFKKKLFTMDAFIGYYEGRLKELGDSVPHYTADMLDRLKSERDGDESHDAAAFSRWLYYVRRWLMYVVVWKFFDRYDDIMDGKLYDDLFTGTFHEKTLEILKGAMGRFVYDGEDLVPTELSGQRIISSLLDGFVHAVLYSDGAYSEDGKYKPRQIDKKYLGLLPTAYMSDYKLSRTGDEAHDLYLRLLTVTDHISSMTDAYARTLYRQLIGIE